MLYREIIRRMDIDTDAWIHVLLKGEKDEEDKNDEYLQEFARRHLTALKVPTLQFNYKNFKQLEELIVKSLGETTCLGFILTSPRVVEAISLVLSNLNSQKRLSLNQRLNTNLVFAVGQKTGAQWAQKTSFEYNKEATMSGDSSRLSVYIKNHCASLTPTKVKLIYPKGSLAHQLIEDSLSGIPNLSVHSIVVYETNVIENICDSVVDKLNNLLAKEQLQLSPNLQDAPSIRRSVIVNLIFFSPSGFSCFSSGGLNCIVEELEKKHKRTRVRLMLSCIGNTTAKCLEDHGFEVHCVSKEPNASSLADCIVDKCFKVRI